MCIESEMYRNGCLKKILNKAAILEMNAMYTRSIQQTNRKHHELVYIVRESAVLQGLLQSIIKELKPCDPGTHHRNMNLDTIYGATTEHNL